MKRPTTAEFQGDGKKIHLESDDADNIQSQDTEKESVIDERENQPVGMGSIQSVELVNFMCHSYLKVDLGPNINFITGSNGSGKSAILTAITIALGGKAKFTNRASSISNLLKEGTQYYSFKRAGEVTIRFRNTGPEAYNHDDYGDVIVIQRKITKDGPAPYRIMNERGKTISNKKEELTAICDHFYIEADNPMAILTQDTARMFLAGSSAKDKYRFFLRGTQLERVMNDYQSLDSQIEYISSILEKKSKVLPELFAEVEALQKRWKEIEQNRNLENVINDLQAELIWSKVAALEAKQQEARDKVRAKDLEVQKKKKVILDTDQLVDEQKIAFRGLEKRLTLAKEELAPLNTRAVDLNSKINSTKQKQRQYETEKREAVEKISEIEKTIRETESKIDQDNEQNQSHAKFFCLIRTLLEKNALKLNELNQELERCRNEIISVNQDIHVLDADYAKQQGESDVVKNHMNRFRGLLKQSKETLHHLQNQGNDRISAFGSDTRQILNDIDRFDAERKWRGHKPVGPIGLFVKITEEKFSTVVESVLDKVLNGYVVENDHDYQLLQKILSQYRGGRVPVFKTRFQKGLDFESGRPSKELKTMYDVLNISNEIVLQQLIINSRIEKNVLVRDQDEGDSLTRNSYPKNVSNVYSPDCFIIGSRHGGLSTTALNRYRGPPRISQDLTSAIRRQEHDVSIKERDLMQAEKHLDSMTQSLREFPIRKRRLAEQDNQLRSSERRCRHEISQLQALMEDVETTNVTVLKQLLQESLQEKSELDNQLNAITQVCKQALIELQELEAQRRDNEHELRSSKQAVSQITAEKEEVEKQIQKYLQIISLKERELDPAVQDFEYLESIAEQIEESLKLQIAQCLEYSERVVVTKSTEQIEYELRKATARIKEKEQEYGSPEIFHRGLEKKRNAYNNAKMQCEEFRNNLVYIKTSRKLRHNRFLAIKKFISIRAKRLFSSLVRRRGYRGVLKLDHEKEELDLEVDVENVGVEPSQTQRMNADKDPSALSGGEKSFSTICLLLALWDSMTSPFRGLDEFDVFMDAVNRRLAMKLIVEHSRDEHNHCQYLLISPQSTTLNDLQGPDIKILKLKKPERGNSRITQESFNRPLTSSNE